MKNAIGVLTVVAATSVLAGDFKLRRDDTAREFGPFAYRSGAKLKLGESTFTLLSRGAVDGALPATLRCALLLHLGFEDEGTRLTDLSGEGHAATARETSRATEAKIGAGLDLDGSASFVEVPDAQSLRFGKRDFTICIWVFPTGWPEEAEGLHALVTKHDGDEGSWLLRLVRNEDTGGKPRLNFETCMPERRYYSKGQIAEEVWQQVGITRIGKTYTFYINGRESGSFADSTEFTTECPIRISGQGNVDKERFRGTIDELMVFSRGLSDLEMACLYVLQR